MRTLRIAPFLILLLLVGICKAQDDALRTILSDWHETFDSVLQNKSTYRLQIIYSQIDRDKDNKPTIRTYTFDADSYYYYCASMVKLLAAPLAIEKLNAKGVYDLSIYDSIYIPKYECSGLNDKMLKRRYPNASAAQFIKEMLLVSNNEAFNPLYDVLAPEYFNTRLKQLGITSAVICSRFASCDSAADMKSNPVEFYDRKTATLKYRQAAQAAEKGFPYTGEFSPFVGKGVYREGTVVNQPMNFSNSNYVKLSVLHRWLTRLIFPELWKVKPNISESDYAFLRKYMGMFPRESVFPKYTGKDYPDNKMKYFIGVDSLGAMPSNIRIYNKVGLAYGFVTDCSYFVDTLNKVEFFLSASIYVNKNEIINDGVYEYDLTAMPFFKNLGTAVYLYELNREKKYKPKFYEWDFEDGVY